MRQHRASRVLVAVTLVTAALPFLDAGTARAAVIRCVGPGAGCLPTLQAALDASADGDTVRLGPGVVTGGVRVGRSITLVGAGRGRTLLQGGDPVVTVDGDPGQHVEISDLTVTGGRARGGPDGVEAAGGGVLVPPGAGGTLGASLTLRRVVVTRNRAEPRTTRPAPLPTSCAAERDCRFASAVGGGIASWGDLTLVDSVVSHNVAGGRASAAAGGGVYGGTGVMRIESSTVAHNVVRPSDLGRTAEGGGVYLAGGDLVLDDSSVDANTADLRTRWPGASGVSSWAVRAAGGGLFAEGYGTVTVDGSSFRRNVASAEDPVGQPRAYDSALRVEGPTTVVSGATITGNTVRVRGARVDTQPASGGVAELDGSTTVRDTLVRGNRVSAVARRGGASAVGGLVFVNYFDASASLDRVAVLDNTVTARSRAGRAQASGGGLLNSSSLTVSAATIEGNVVRAQGADALARGGGVLNEDLGVGNVALTLSRSTVRRNVARTSPGGTATGGGVLSSAELHLVGSAVVGNRPDQCAGCGTR